MALLTVEVPHPRFIGVRGEAGADTARKEDPHLRLHSVGLKSYVFEVGAQGVKGPLEEGRVLGHDEAVVGEENCQEAADVRKVYGSLHLHQPRLYNGVHHEVEDGGGEGAAG